MASESYTKLPGLDAEVRLPKALFYYAGVAGLIAWNLTLTFTHTFDSVMLQSKTFGDARWGFWCALSYSLSLNLVQAVTSSRAIMRSIPFGARWIGSLVGMVLSMTVLLACTHCSDGDKSNLDVVFTVAIAAMILMGFAAGAFQSCSFGMAGAISPQLSQALMTGQGIAGVAAGGVGFCFGGSLLNLRAIFPVGASFILLGVLLYFQHLRRNPIIAHQLEICDRLRASESKFQAGEHVVNPRSSVQIFMDTAWPQACTVCSVFAATFCVFPGVVSRWLPGRHVPLTIATFQLMDAIGRWLPMYKTFCIMHGPTVSLLAGLRFFFIPAFILFERCGDEQWARKEVLQCSLTMVLAFSNGYVSTLSMMLGTIQSGIAEDEKEAAGAIMSFALTLGILIGSFLAFLIS